MKSYSPEMIQNMVADPMTYNEELRKLSRQIYNSNGIISSAIDFMVCLPTLDRVVVPKGKSKKNGKANVELVQETLSLIKDKEFIRDALLSGILDGTTFYYAEFAKPTNDNTKFLSDYEVDSISEINSLDFNMSIISLPTDYCKIRGLKNSNYVVVFNLRFFDEYNGKLENVLKKYPSEIRNGYQKYKESGSNNNWLVLDSTRTIVFKIKSTRDEVWGRPLILGSINDILYSDYFLETKKKILHDYANQFIFQTFPEGKEKGTSALSSTQQREQHEAVKGAITSRVNRNGVTMVSVAAGTKIDNLKVDSDIFDENVENKLEEKISSDLGFGISLLNASSSGNYSTQQNNLSLTLAKIYSWVEQIANELNKVVNTHVIKSKNDKVEIVYLPISRVNNNEFITQMKELYTLSGGSRLAWIASTGIPVDAYITLMRFENNEGYNEEFLPHPTSFTISDSADKSNPDDNVGGRPSKSGGDITNNSTNQSKTNNGNQPKPSTK